MTTGGTNGQANTTPPKAPVMGDTVYINTQGPSTTISGSGLKAAFIMGSRNVKNRLADNGFVKKSAMLSSEDTVRVVALEIRSYLEIETLNLASISKRI